MSAPGEEKEWQANDQIAAANSTNHPEPIATEPLTRVGTEKELNAETQIELDSGGSEKHVHENTISRTDSAVSETSGDDSDVKSEKKELPKRSWGERLNPLKSKHKPPVPSERQQSREHGANIFSIITFQWIAPLMKVSVFTINKCPRTNHRSRSGIKDHSNPTTYGLSTQTGVSTFLPRNFLHLLASASNEAIRSHWSEPFSRPSNLTLFSEVFVSSRQV